MVWVVPSDSCTRYRLQLGKPEIEDLEPPFRRDHEIRRLDIAVSDSLLMRSRKSVGKAVRRDQRFLRVVQCVPLAIR